MLKGYKGYREIPEFWISSIPDNWDSIKIKHIFKERVEKGYPNKPLLAATQNMGVVPKDVYGNRTVEAIKDLHLLKLVKVGDFVISLRSFQGGIEYAYYEGIISPAYTVMIPYNSNSHFFRYLFKSVRFVELLQNCVTGIREGQNIDYSKLRNHFIPIPPRPEQDQIVRYLDWKISMINKYINAKKKQIELLKEQKQAIINQAVTKGLNPEVPMRESGVLSIGCIPKNWHIHSFLKIADVKANLVNPEEHPNLLQVSPANIEKNTGRLLECQTVKQSGIISDNHYFYKGQILYSKIRPLLNKVTIAPFDGLCSADMYPIETSLDIEYLKYFMLSQAFLSQLSITGNRVKMPKINKEELAKIIVAFPDENEQQTIVKYIITEFHKINSLIINLNNTITLLQEYRTRLISDVVTGKVNVQNIEVEEFENTECQNNNDSDEEVE
jgi:type I restriction enzyme S subunit